MDSKQPDVQESKRHRASMEESNNGNFLISEGPDWILIERDGTSRAWRINLLDLMGTTSAGGGALVVLEALDGLQKIAQLTIQVNEQGTASRLSFSTQGAYLNLSYNDLTSSSRVPAIVETPEDTYHLVLNIEDAVHDVPPTHEQAMKSIQGTLPTLGQYVFKEVTEEFAQIEQVLREFAKVREDEQACADNLASGVIFQKQGDKKECKRKRKSGWAILGSIAVLGVIAVSTDGLGVAIVGGLAVGAGAGARASDVEAEYKKCKEDAEKKKQ